MTYPSKDYFVGLKYGFRSGLEKRVADELTSQGILFSYEEQKIEYTRPARQSKYTPDFVIGTMIIETKGRFQTDDRAKHLLIKDQHPHLDIRFVFSNPKQRISKTSKTTYAMWCLKHDFKFAKGSIPIEWLSEKQLTT
tara:strand:- start:12412 stop:12825 length:414 start_codon:yes stop_codon:yes gene_type:complete